VTAYAIGDIQGCSRAFDALLAKLDFDPERDHLWLVGDLVNRGPDSVGVLRRVVGLAGAATCVLGNHDLHLLAVATGIRPPTADDTFIDVLDAPDAAELLDWLRRRPLLYHDAAAARVLVHAGIPPCWTLERALQEAARVEASLDGDDWPSALRDMYGRRPRAWSPELPAADKRRYTINALAESGPPGSQPAELVPWFDWPRREPLGCRVVFGHWSALGVMRRGDVIGLDSGCVWGHALTAVDLDDVGRLVQIDCGG
jgi:bis(5'-nucleosyl)-tetraphosphatase (symmetrical)